MTTTEKTFKVDVYETKVVIVIANTASEILDHVEDTTDLDLDDAKDDFEASLIAENDGEIIVGYVKDKITYGTIAHECYHICCRMLRRRSIRDEEAYAYLLDYLVEKSCQKLKKWL